MQQAGGEEKAVHFWEKDHGVRLGMERSGVESG